MFDAFTRVVSQADARGEFLSTAQIDALSNMVKEGNKRMDAVNRISGNNNSIVTNAARELFKLKPMLLASGGNAHSIRGYIIFLRELSFILRYITHAIFSGDASALEDRCLNGLSETYAALGIPENSVAVAIKIMKELVLKIVNDPNNITPGDCSALASEIATYFDRVEAVLLIVNRSVSTNEHDSIEKPTSIPFEKLGLNHPIKYYQGKEQLIIQKLNNKKIEPEQWKKLIDILLELDTKKARIFLEKLLFPPYNHNYWESALDFNIASLQNDKIIVSLLTEVLITSLKNVNIEERNNAIILIERILDQGTLEAKLASVRLINSFSDRLLDRRLFQPLVDLWIVCRTDKPKWLNFIRNVLQYFVYSLNQKEDGSYDVVFKSQVT